MKNLEKLLRKVDDDSLKKLSMPKFMKVQTKKKLVKRTKSNTKGTTGKISDTALLKCVEIKTLKSDNQKLSAKQLTSIKKHCYSKSTVKKTTDELEVNKPMKSETRFNVVEKKSKVTKKDIFKKSVVKKPTTTRKAEDNVNFRLRKKDKYLCHSFEYNGNPFETLNHGSLQPKERTIKKCTNTYVPIYQGDIRTIDHSVNANNSTLSKVPRRKMCMRKHCTPNDNDVMKSDLNLMKLKKTTGNTTVNFPDQLFAEDGKRYSVDVVPSQSQEMIKAEDNVDEICKHYRKQILTNVAPTMKEYRGLIDGKNTKFSKKSFAKSVNSKEVSEARTKLLMDNTKLQSTNNFSGSEISCSEERLNNIDKAHLNKGDEKNESKTSRNGESGVFSAINSISDFKETSDSSFLLPDEQTTLVLMHHEEKFFNVLERNSNENCTTDNGVYIETLLQNVRDPTSTVDTDNFKINEANSTSNSETLVVSDDNDYSSSEEQKAESIVEVIRAKECLNSLQIATNVLDDLNVRNDDESVSLLLNHRPSTVIDGQSLPSRLQKAEKSLKNSERADDEIVTNQNDSDEWYSREISWENAPEGTASLISVDELLSTVQDADSGQTSDANAIRSTHKSLIVASKRRETGTQCTDYRSPAASENGVSVTTGRCCSFVTTTTSARKRANRRALSSRNVLRRRGRQSETIPPWAVIFLVINLASLLLFEKRSVNNMGRPTLFSSEGPVCDTVGGRKLPMRKGERFANGPDDRGRDDDEKFWQQLMWPVPMLINEFLCTDLLQYCREPYDKELEAKDNVLRECRELCNRIVAGRTKQNAQGPATDDTLNDLTLMLRCHYEAALR